MVERTLAIVKPDAIQHEEEIIDLAKSNGFVILEKRRLHLTPEQASDFYIRHYGLAFFASLITYMSSGPVVVLVLARENAVSAWREMMGPTNSSIARVESPKSIRARFGTDNQRNAVHGSDSVTSAQKEIRFFFPNTIADNIPSAKQARDSIEQTVTPTLTRALTALCKAKPADPLTWLADWLVENNPNKPKVVEPEN
eukprot:m.34417 g.34417  ORF g.34417 m.34417 type:complete len:198 (+) comp11147_c0_seq1:93-686(+)